MDLIVLVCVVSAALAVGVLAAYGMCMAMFTVFQMHARQSAVKKPVAVAVPSSASANTATAIGG